MYLGSVICFMQIERYAARAGKYQDTQERSKEEMERLRDTAEHLRSKYQHELERADKLSQTNERLETRLHEV